MRQETATVVARVDDVPRLRAALAEAAAAKVGQGTRRHQPRIFADAGAGIHFARLVLIPGDAGRRFEDLLAFESNFDTVEASTDAAELTHFSALSQLQTAALSRIFAACAGFGSVQSAERLTTFLAEHRVAATAAYQGHTYRDLERIELERHLRELLLRFFEGTAAADRPTLYKRARDHVRMRSRLDPGLRGFDIDAAPPEDPDPAIRSDRLKNRILPWITNAGPALPLLHRLREILMWQHEDSYFDLRARQEGTTEAERQRYREIADSEDHGTQNAITHVVPLRGGDGRLATLRTAHAYIDRMAREYFDDIGQLGGIPSIHFAKWFLIDEGRRLVFFSNYDSSWESYLGDFVDQAAVGLNLAWSCTEEYPRTNLLAFGGASDEERFKAWGRAYQQPTQVFYSAYPEASIAAINNNTLIRHGLQRRPGTGELASWFRRLT